MNSREFERNDFYNPDHLNKAGAYKFAAILNDSLRDLNKKQVYKMK